MVSLQLKVFVTSLPQPEVLFLLNPSFSSCQETRPWLNGKYYFYLLRACCLSWQLCPRDPPSLQTSSSPFFSAIRWRSHLYSQYCDSGTPASKFCPFSWPSSDTASSSPSILFPSLFLLSGFYPFNH